MISNQTSATGRRQRRGYRVLFDKRTDLDAWYMSQFLLKKLSAERCRQLRTPAECMALEDAIAAVESGQ